ncbi:MAG: hypothetical protein J7639_26380 [Paenibacillaceae bacterium]|nr:hypothetical protein [Paenibacillaceae bacterium]
MKPYYVIGSQTPRPISRKTLFADGSRDATFRPGIDIDLSHCRPNTTPPAYKADTSAEICMKYLADSGGDDWDLCVIDHIDLDGILSAFTLLHPNIALPHRNVIIGAASMGDFWDWGDGAAQAFYQSMTRLMNELQQGNTDLQLAYGRCFRHAIALLRGEISEHDRQAIRRGQDVLAASTLKISSGQVVRTVAHPHFVHYAFPRMASLEQLRLALAPPKFNGPLDETAWLHFQARNRLDREKVQLISIAAEDGWYFDLWYPGYVWAETPDSWNAPGLTFTGGRDEYSFDHAPLGDAVRALAATETAADGEWRLTTIVTPSVTLAGRGFPIVLSFVNEAHRPVPSRLPPKTVAARLAPCFAAP